MEFFITILLMLVPLIFKVIEKGLNKAAPSQTSSQRFDTDVDEELETIRNTLNEVFPEIGQSAQVEESDIKDDLSIDDVRTEFVPASKLVEIHSVKQVSVGKSLNGGKGVKSLAADIDAKEKKEKIDAKKLIIYSEIMKPKY